MYCQKCGKELPDGAKFCAECGSTASAESPKPTKEKKKKPIFARWWFWVIVIIIAVAACSGEGETEAPDGDNHVDQIVETQPKEIVIEVSPEDLHTAYQENEVAADAQYEDKLVKITGTIGNIGKDILDDVYITIETGEYLQSVQCYFSDNEQINTVATLKAGDTVTLIGRCSGLSLTNVIIKDCEIQ